MLRFQESEYSCSLITKESIRSTKIRVCTLYVTSFLQLVSSQYSPFFVSPPCTCSTYKNVTHGNAPSTATDLSHTWGAISFSSLTKLQASLRASTCISGYEQPFILGSKSLTSWVCLNKKLFKILFKNGGVPKAFLIATRAFVLYPTLYHVRVSMWM